MKIILSLTIILFCSIISTYTIVGTDGNVQEIKKRVPIEIIKRNWSIIRYEGFQYGSWSKHGGKVWYHVCNIDNPNIQYRVFVTMWDGELQWYYNEPESLNRIQLNSLK